MSRATQDDGSGDLSERDVPSYRKYLFIQTRHQKKLEFKSLTNIESSFKRIRLMLAVFACCCALVTGYALWSSYRFAEKQREKIYVLDGGKSLMMALSQDLSQNRPAEAREHVRRFHELIFLALTPEGCHRAQYQPCPATGRQECLSLLCGFCRKRVLQPPDIGQHQSGGACGQRGVRLAATLTRCGHTPGS